MAAGSVCYGQAAVEEAAEPAEDAGVFQAGQDSEMPAGQNVEVDALGKIDLHVKDLDLVKVLQLLSIQSQRNIIASRNVSGTISADLYQVDFYDALDAILQINGYGYVEKGNFIYVYTQKELEDIEKAQRQITTKVVRLNYLSASDAAKFLSPMISSAGQLSVSDAAPTGFEPSSSDAGGNTTSDSDLLVIRDYADVVEEILTVLEQLDVRPKQVLVEATVLQARLIEANAFGVDFALFGDLDIANFTNPLNLVDDLITGNGGGAGLDSGQGMTTNVGNVQSGPAGVKVGVLGSNASVFVRALDSVADTTVLSQPKLLVLNRQKASLQVGQRLGYLSTTQSQTTSTQSVEFLDVGTQLALRPFVSDDGFVRLELRPSVSDGDTSRVVDGFVVPTENTQELVTNVVIRSGQTIVLGGLFVEDTSVSRNQVPGVGNIPGIGNAFRGQDDNVTRDEVIFLVKATVMKDQSLVDGGKTAEEGIRLARIGARQGMLPWSRTKLTSSHMRHALDALEKGDKDKALWNVNLALYLDPTMTDALKLKSELTGEKLYFHHKSILKEVVDDMINLQVDETAPIEEALDPEPMEVDSAEEPMGDATELQHTPAETESTEQAQVTDQVTEPVAEATETQEPAQAVDAGQAVEDAETEQSAQATETVETTADASEEVELVEIVEESVVGDEPEQPVVEVIAVDDQPTDTQPAEPEVIVVETEPTADAQSSQTPEQVEVEADMIARWASEVLDSISAGEVLEDAEGGGAVAEVPTE